MLRAVALMLAERGAKTGAARARLEDRHPSQAPVLSRRLAQVAELARQREAVRSELTRLVQVVRAWALVAGRLCGLGDGIFFLTHDEMIALLSGWRVPVETIPTRQETYERYRRLPAYPPLICGHFDPEQWAATLDRRSDYYDSHLADRFPVPGRPAIVRGLPGSAGRAEWRS